MKISPALLEMSIQMILPRALVKSEVGNLSPILSDNLGAESYI